MDGLTRRWLSTPPIAVDGSRHLDVVSAVAADDRGGITATTQSGVDFRVGVTSPGPGIVRLRFTRNGAPPHRSALLTDGYVDTRVTVTANDGGVAFATDGVDGDWQPGSTGLRLGACRTAAYLGTLLGPGLGTGVVTGGEGPPGWQLALALDADAAVYGGGEAFQGPDLRGRVRRCVNVETHGAAGLDYSYLTVPLFWTDGGWGVYVHSGAPVRADIGATHPSALSLDIEGDELDVFVYQGDAAQIIRQHHEVTGRPGRIPEWALGVWTSRCSYFSAAEIDAIVDGYRDADCPVDVVHVDAWQNGDVVKDLSTAWEVDRDRFPIGWGKRLADRGVRLSLWHNPYVRAGTRVGDEAIARGFVLRDAAGEPVGTNDMPERLVVDMTNPDAAAWWRNLVAGLLRDEGAVSVKGDFAEEIPPTAQCADGRTGWQVRNEYAVRYQHESNAALREVLGTDDVVMFNRSGTAGAQRYPGHWVGDTPSTWVGFEAAVRACLSLSLSGFGVVASDVGGFWTDKAIEVAATACTTFDESLFTADVDPELFLRWTQWGALSPLMRFHGTGRREPWAYPAPYGPLAVEACRLRARLRGYLDRAAADAAEVGTPMIRPMPLAFPGDRAARAAELQYLLGPDLLVAPVLQPGGRVQVWVPDGGWRGLAGAPTLDDAGWYDVTLPLDAVPVWLRPSVDTRTVLEGES